MLTEHPQAGTPCKLPIPRLSQLRRFPITLPFGRWLILYLDRPEGILILRVLHGSQDWQKLFR
jgi:plasmid stabilization system protein ParE